MRQAGFYSRPIKVERGCTQGDIDSPVIFNLIVDAVIRSAKEKGEHWGSILCFYADDGLVENVDPEKLQLDLNKLVDLFKRVGLETNEIKTKLMAVRGKQVPSARTRETYNRLRRDAKPRKKRRTGVNKREDARSVGRK